MKIIRAWKDEEYRMSLSDEELSLLPDNPAGPMELSDGQLESIVGGSGKKDDDLSLVCDNESIVGCSLNCDGSIACDSVAFCDSKH
jgi:mersacidin/lichenicidin family type 2 lantibiotic